MAQDAYTALLAAVEEGLHRETPLLVAIDGRCGSGKSTLAEQLRRETGCALFHMDDFFLPPSLRTAQRLSQPGENVDHQRFREEVLLPVRRGQTVTYRPYRCRTQSLDAPVVVEPRPLTVVEGAYACHASLWDAYHLRVFLTTSPDRQLRRLEARCGAAGLRQFREQWIPLEEAYFSAFQVPERCHLYLET